MLIYRARWLEGGVVTWHLDLTLSDHRAAMLKKSTVGMILESDTMYFAFMSMQIEPYNFWKAGTAPLGSEDSYVWKDHIYISKPVSICLSLSPFRRRSGVMHCTDFLSFQEAQCEEKTLRNSFS